MYDLKPDYFVYGGFVFTTISFDYLLQAKPEIHDDLFEDKAFTDEEAVAIASCFADVGIEGYIGCGKSLVRDVNGVKVRNLRHLVELVDSCKNGFVSFGLDCDTKWDTKVIVDAKEMREATSRVMKRNQIPADRSEDLRKK